MYTLSTIFNVDIDTTHFSGNQPMYASLEACQNTKKLNSNSKWSKILNYKKLSEIEIINIVNEFTKGLLVDRVIEVDFGDEIGINQSSAQITHYYDEEQLTGKQDIGVCNFPEKN